MVKQSVQLILMMSLLSLLAACQKGDGFQAENIEYVLAEPEKPSVTPPAATESSEDTGKVRRNKKKVNFQNIQSDWKSSNSQLSLKAEVTIDGKNLGLIEFEGKKQDSKIVLVPKNEELKNKVKAQVRCLSEDDSCQDHYIELVFKDQEKDVIYIDQILPAGVKNPEDAKPPGSPPAQPVPQPTTPATPEEQDEKFENFMDLVDIEQTKKSGFQGSPDDELIELMKDVEPAKPQEPAPAPAPTPKPPQNAAPPPGKPVDPPKPAPQPQTPTHANPVFQELEKFRTIDQSINFPMTWREHGRTIYGRVQKATDFSKVAQIPGIGFLIPPGRESIYGSFHLATVLAKMGEFMKEIIPNKPLQVTSISRFNGGPRPPGVSHQNGTDADIRYLRARDSENVARDIVDGNRVSNNFLVKEQWLLLKKTWETGQVELIAVDEVVKKSLCEYALMTSDYKRGQDNTFAAELLKRIVPTEGHEDHFHVRVKCGPRDRDCRSFRYKEYKVGC